MLKSTTAVVKSIQFENQYIAKLIVTIENKDYNCINYNQMTGFAKQGDKLLVNTTAVELKLGTGGNHFVMANLNHPSANWSPDGHIMKLRYTPMQISCLSAEAQESPYHDLFNQFKSLDEMPILIGTLHSMLAPCCVYLKYVNPLIKIAYIMTDGGALPIHISDLVRELRDSKLLDVTITYGNSFGGDIEAINIYTALAAAKEIAAADIAIVCMGPGIVGTDTKYGFSGIEQGSIIDAVNKLKGYPIAIPRISFADQRERHYGLSHHSITVLKDVCCTKANVPVPILSDSEQMKLIKNEIEKNRLDSLHNVFYVDTNDIIDRIIHKSSCFNKMGMGFQEDKAYFIACAAAAKHGVGQLS